MPMRSAPRAARATAGFCKPASQSSTAGAPATVSFGKLMSQQQPSMMLGWSSTAGMRAAVGSSELTSLYAFGSVPQRVVQTAPVVVSFGELMPHNALGTVPMRSAPRAARATVGFSEPTSRYAFGFVPGVVPGWHGRWPAFASWCRIRSPARRWASPP